MRLPHQALQYISLLCVQAQAHSARHENAHSDEFALSGDQEGQHGREGGQKDKAVYIDLAPLTDLFQVGLLEWTRVAVSWLISTCSHSRSVCCRNSLCNLNRACTVNMV